MRNHLHHHKNGFHQYHYSFHFKILFSKNIAVQKPQWMSSCLLLQCVRCFWTTFLLTHLCKHVSMSPAKREGRKSQLHYLHKNKDMVVHRKQNKAFGTVLNRRERTAVFVLKGRGEKGKNTWSCHFHSGCYCAELDSVLSSDCNTPHMP